MLHELFLDSSSSWIKQSSSKGSRSLMLVEFTLPYSISCFEYLHEILLIQGRISAVLLESRSELGKED